MVTTGKKAATVISASVLLQVLLPFLLSVCIMVIHQVQHQRILNNLGDLSNFQRVALSPADRPTAGAEWQRNGELYDVALITNEHGQRVAYLLADDEETSLTRLLPDPHKNRNSNPSILPFVFLYHEQPIQWALRYVPTYTLVHTERYSPSTCCYHGNISLPPPRSC